MWTMIAYMATNSGVNIAAIVLLVVIVLCHLGAVDIGFVDGNVLQSCSILCLPHAPSMAIHY